MSTFSEKVAQQIYDAAGGACCMCHRVRPFEKHHIVPKGMGGRKGAAKKTINRADNGMLVCHICHEATHGVRAIDSDGFSCDLCPAEWACEHSQAKVRKSTGLPVIVAKDQGYKEPDELADDQLKGMGL